MEAIGKKSANDLVDRIDKVQGILRGIEYRMEDEQEAVILFNRVLDIFDKTVEFDSKGKALPEHIGMANLAESITDWLNQRKFG